MESSTSRTRSRRTSGSSYLQSSFTALGRTVSGGLRGHGMEEVRYRRGYRYATVAAAIIGCESRCEEVWVRGTQRRGACATESTNVTQDGQPAHFRRLLNAFNAAKKDGGARGSGQFRAVPALTPSVAKCYGTRLADVFFWMGPGEIRGRSLVSAVSIRGTLWDRQYYVSRCDRGRSFSERSSTEKE